MGRMGGRGSYSVTGGKIHIGSLMGGKNDIKNIGGDTDPRNDIHVMYEDELGFSDVRGLENLPTASLGAIGITLNRLEHEYGALTSLGVGSMDVLGMDSASAIAAVRSDYSGKPNALLINRKKFENMTRRNNAQRRAEKDGWSMPTDGSTLAVSRYATTHEYGHIIEAALYQNAKVTNPLLSERRHARNVANNIIKIAQSKYGAKQSDISTYGTHDTYEFFAESFANMKSGSPNAFGKAMRDYLKKQKI